MSIDILILFIIIIFICFLLTLFTIEETPILALPLVAVGMVFSTIVTFAIWDVEFFYTGYNSTFGNTTTGFYAVSYGEPYSYVFFLMFWIFVILFIKSGFNVWRDAIQGKSEITKQKNNNGRD